MYQRQDQRRDPVVRPARRARMLRGRARIIVVVSALILCAGITAIACNLSHARSNESLSYGRSGEADTSSAAAVPLYEAVTIEETDVRSGCGADTTVVEVLAAKTSVSVMAVSAVDDGWVQVKTPAGNLGWCGMQYLCQESDLEPSADAVSTPQITLKEAALPLSVTVSISEQRVTVYDAKSRVVKQFICSTGIKGSETPTGTFTVTGRGQSFFSESLQEGGYYWTQFYGDYLFHSVPFDKNYEIEADEAAKLGTPASHGCVRLSVEDAKWIYDNIPDGTAVTIS